MMTKGEALLIAIEETEGKALYWGFRLEKKMTAGMRKAATERKIKLEEAAKLLREEVL